jgi:hypothetical protein
MSPILKELATKPKARKATVRKANRRGEKRGTALVI